MGRGKTSLCVFQILSVYVVRISFDARCHSIYVFHGGDDDIIALRNLISR